MIPPEIEGQHVRQAMDQLGPDKDAWPAHRQSIRYDVIHPDPLKRWRMPPKLVISVAAELATGAKLDPQQFDAREARDWLTRHQFQLIDRQKP